jgi:hypothetical protein
VRPDKLDISDLHSVRECHDQSVFVARDVEDNAVVSNDAGISVLGFDRRGAATERGRLPGIKFLKVLHNRCGRAVPKKF